MAPRSTTTTAGTANAGLALSQVLLDRAAWVHARLDTADLHGVQLHEETITQSLMLDIAQTAAPLHVKVFTKHQESRNGADWQWWFGGAEWFGMRIQAKRLRRLKPKNTSVNYDLGYRIGFERQRQVDRLIDAARGDRLQAGYVLYSGSALDFDRVDWRCGLLEPTREHLGVSFVPAVAVQSLLDSERRYTAEEVASLSRPWSCLIGCPGSAGNCGSPLGAGSRKSAMSGGINSGRLAWAAAAGYFRSALDLFDLNDDDERFYVQVSQHLVSEPPTYVSALLQGGGSQVTPPPGIRGVMVFHDGQEH